MECVVYRCGRQDEMYLYLRKDLSEQDLPPALRERSGRLSEVMKLHLHPQRRLARCDVEQVMAQLQHQGYYLQLPPEGAIRAHLHFGD